ncbi:zinc finger CCCH domain-containing protein 1 [Malania oleifera]|uniref:zinc finger CCCH domain-containing protein 1 n=1 Tax=Malania oleifera TaxID=397392 RepID=UPI0025AE5025|nr:zinc finger CCCH domain-containing protein 1 [Malania oleifera]
MASGPICWKSMLQVVVALSTNEAEYMTVIEAAKKAMWLKGLKLVKSKNIRKRTFNENEDLKNESSVVHNLKKPVKPDSVLHFSTGPSKQSMATVSNVESQNSIFQFESSKEIQVQHDSRAAATLETETETEFSKDARAIRESALKQAEEALKGKNNGSGGEKLYKGIHGYTDYKAGFRREQTVSGEKAGGAHGPLRASAHIRVSARFDYQPDICKDYKETGYCGYGDACKFMHDQGDYKFGWQLEEEWEEAEKAKKRILALGGDDISEGGDDQSEEDEDDSLPFACFICRQPFVDPVVTKCKHYFCEHCALKHHSRNKKCFVCNQPTLGIFNTAHEICKKMAAERK